MDNFPRFDRLGIFLSRLDPLWLCTQIRTGSTVAAGRPVCPGAHQQTRSGNAFHHLWRFCVRMGSLPNPILCVAVPDPLVHCDIHHYGRGRACITAIASRFLSSRVNCCESKNELSKLYPGSSTLGPQKIP